MSGNERYDSAITEMIDLLQAGLDAEYGRTLGEPESQLLCALLKEDQWDLLTRDSDSAVVLGKLRDVLDVAFRDRHRNQPRLPREWLGWGKALVGTLGDQSRPRNTGFFWLAATWIRGGGFLDLVGSLEDDGEWQRPREEDATSWSISVICTGAHVLEQELAGDVGEILRSSARLFFTVPDP